MSSAEPKRRPREVVRSELPLHGHAVSYLEAGSGPVILLVHGITGRAEQWVPVMELLSDRFTLVAPDLLGHGRSAKPRGDYSLGAYAAGLRDLMLALGHERVTVVGHSLGGGVAMQFAYQFPERCERLVLASSGGLGREVHLVLRAAALPGADLVLPLISHRRLVAAGAAFGGALQRVGVQAGPDLGELARGYGSLADAEARHAFLLTLRAVIDPAGQRVSATDRLYLAAEMPVLIVWGARDRIIPLAHGQDAHEAMPGSTFEVFDHAGHFPQLADPARFSRALSDFIDESEPAGADPAVLRDRLLAGRPA
jgi:pimeloyl-ACP methyl ester carboxylesterase